MAQVDDIETVIAIGGPSRLEERHLVALLCWVASKDDFVGRQKPFVTALIQKLKCFVGLFLCVHQEVGGSWRLRLNKVGWEHKPRGRCR